MLMSLSFNFLPEFARKETSCFTNVENLGEKKYGSG